ncbi:MAG: hypothetical protein K2Y56_01340 [Methylobacterium sp.]|uniref:hypothetical protein n=1 Tax=Methylobacterium sp. TaxID=409 RepID=UPI0025FF17DF|nr:hypothetical protein [Methylobacterium sp.]MBX9930177.1 hypothetical protein [Methylobacterium sp.]
MARSLLYAHDRRTFPGVEGREHDSTNAIRGEVLRAVVEMTAGSSLTKNACQVRIGARDAFSVRFKTATMPTIIEVPLERSGELSPTDGETPFDERPSWLSHRIHAEEITRHAQSADRLNLMRPLANQGSK